MIFGDRLLIEYIQCGMARPARIKRGNEPILVD
jgi:hypothetical protein